MSPLKKKSTPRLERMGCLSLARAYKTCEEALEFAGISNYKRMFWIDSQIVLSWLKTCPRQFKPFVSVRVVEIQGTIDPEEFHFVKSSHNQADAVRWPNTVFDTCVSFTFFSKTLDPFVTKNGRKQVNNTNISFLIVKLTYLPLPWQHD